MLSWSIVSWWSPKLSPLRNPWLHRGWTLAYPCPSPTPGVDPNSCPSSQWCHPTISSSVVPFSSCPQSFPKSGSFQMSQLRIRWPKYWSFSFNISPFNEHQDLFPIWWTGWISLQSKGLSRVFSYTTIRKHQFFGIQPSLQSNSHIHHDYWKTIALTIQTFVSNVSAF